MNIKLSRDARKRIALILALPLLVAAIALPLQVFGQERKPTREELIAAFDRVTRPVPAPLHISATVRIKGRPGTQDEIDRATQRNVEHLESSTGQILTELELEKLRELFTISLSGTKEFTYELWRSRQGKLYRLDEIETSLGPETTDFTSVNIRDTTFTNVPSFSASRRLGSADIQWDPTARHAELALWDAIGLEAQLAFPLIAALGKTRSDLDPSVDFETMREAAQIDSAKLQSLLSSTSPNWQIVATDVPDESPPQVQLTLTGRVVTPENFRGRMPEELKFTELRVTYQFDRDNFERLRTVEFFDSGSSMSYKSVRSDFDAQDYPRKWTILEQPGDDLSIKRRTYQFNEIETFPPSKEWEIFAPVFPAHYIVGQLHGDGESDIISNPGGGEVLKTSPAAYEKVKWFLARFLVALAFLLPLGYLFGIRNKTQGRES